MGWDKQTNNQSNKQAHQYPDSDQPEGWPSENNTALFGRLNGHKVYVYISIHSKIDFFLRSRL